MEVLLMERVEHVELTELEAEFGNARKDAS